MLNALSVCLDGGNPKGRARAAQSFQRQGFVHAVSFDWPEGALDAWAHPSQLLVANCSAQTPIGFACCVGPLWYRGRFGAAALHLLLEEMDEGRPLDELELRGNFAIFVRTPEHCLLMNDALGFVRLYVTADRTFYSTSWLATCAYADGVELNEDAAAEYVLLGASHSDRTVADGVTTLPLGHAFDLTIKRARARLPDGIWYRARVPASFEAAADEICNHLQAVCLEIATAFPGGTRAALSGGFDSRLIVAGLLACGEAPDLFVYGDPRSDDVATARSVAGAVGIQLDVIDKAILNRGTPLPDFECLVRSALFFDGLPNDGIFDSGADRQTRLAQNSGGAIALNGGGGEIFRNYFHLRNRSFRAMDIVRTFYRGFDAKVFRRAGGLVTYQHTLASSMQRSLGMGGSDGGQTLGREQVELLYPLFRCHHWMSVNNSVATRHGYYATPLADPKMVQFACRLPLAWKNAGKLESRLVARFHDGIASQPSSYGFRFTDGPDWRARFSEWATCMRPVFARPYISAARRRLHKLGVAPEMMAHCRSLLPGEWRLDPILDLRLLPDDPAFARALAVEVVWRKLFV